MTPAGRNASQHARLFRVFHALCNARFQGEADDRRTAYASWLSLLLGRTVTSSRDLNTSELAAAVQQLLKEVPKAIADRYAHPRDRKRRRSAASQSRTGSAGVSPAPIQFPARNIITTRQLWKIRQVEAFLGWAAVPERLAMFLFDRYKTRHPEQLTFAQAGQVIEALISIAARARVKARLGQSHEVSRDELAQEVSRVKELLRSWQPDPSPEAA